MENNKPLPGREAVPVEVARIFEEVERHCSRRECDAAATE